MNIKNLVTDSLAQNEPSGWFEPLYAGANFDPQKIPWANLSAPAPLTQWLKQQVNTEEKKALVIGCGLGDDAQAIAEAGYQTTAFDISPSAIDWCRQRFPNSTVNYQTGDILNPCPAWLQEFDLVWECRTIQALPLDFRTEVINNIAQLVKPQGKLLVLTNLRPSEEAPSGPPWPLSANDLQQFIMAGLTEEKTTVTGATIFVEFIAIRSDL
ncbi:MAG: class I SAM-dependent methyltransferase [Cyanobacterium sp. T60_A2020_053]|nr:class I SAM-dependent methyltransferase [Cyanobacterium sp. T60_A2020_053]